MFFNSKYQTYNMFCYKTHEKLIVQYSEALIIIYTSLQGGCVVACICNPAKMEAKRLNDER